MTWREEAKELGVAVYDKALKRPRKKLDVMADIEAKKEKPVEVTGPTKIIISIQDATKICSDALFKHVAELGLTKISSERWFLNCKRKGIVFKGIKNDRKGTSEGTEDESEVAGSSVSVSVRDSEREDSPEGTKETVEDERVCCPA